MATLHFVYGPMGAGKSHSLFCFFDQASRASQKCALFVASPASGGMAASVSRTGFSTPAHPLAPDETLYPSAHCPEGSCPNIVIVDEAQFLTRAHVRQLVLLVQKEGATVRCYGLRADVFGNSFEGSAALMAVADTMQELTHVCSCGAIATRTSNTLFTRKKGDDETAVVDTESKAYKAECTRCWVASMVVQEGTGIGMSRPAQQ